MSETIQVILFEESGQWVAQCLEYDIAAQGPNLDTARERFDVTLKAELKESLDRHGKRFGGIPPAPERYQRMWERRARSFELSANPSESKDEPKLDLALVA